MAGSGSVASEPKSPAQAASRASISDDTPTEKPKTRRERRREAKEREKKKLEEDGPPASFKNFFRVLGFGNWFDFVMIGICCSTAIAAGVAMPLMFLVLGNIVNNFTGYFTPGHHITKAEFMHSVGTNALIIFGLFWARLIMSYISMYTIRISGLRISSNLRLAYIQALFRQPVGVIDQVSAGTISSRITASANTIQTGISQQFYIFLQGLASLFGSYIVAFIRSWLLTFVASASLPFILLVYTFAIPFFIKYHREITRYNEQASALAYEILTSIRIVVAFCAEGRLTKKHHEYLEKAHRVDRKLAPMMGFAFAPVMFSMYGTYALTFWFGIRQIKEGHVQNAGSIVTVLFSVMAGVMSLNQLLPPIIQIAKVASAASDILATIEADSPDMTGLKDPDVSPENNITLQGVSFAYPSRRKVQVLNKVNMTFEARKTTAIVGPSGSGKSTIVGLVERWYDLDDYKIPAALRSTRGGVSLGGPRGRAAAGPQRFERPETPPDKKAKTEKTIELPDPPIEGKLFVGDVDLATVDAVWWRQQIGLVQQEPVLFNDTIFTNVVYGLYGTQYDDLPDDEKLKMVEDACRQASADEFITKLPHGYMTMVGESGIKLSGGQRQRLAIARSIIKKPTILILDEATSAIDVRTERIVQEALDRVSANRTTIVIAHRLSTIKKADKIIVLRKGEVMEQGTHSQLLENEDGIYYGLVRAQAIAMTAENESQDEEYDDNVVDLDDERPELVKTKSNRSGLGPAQEHDGVMTKDGLVAGYKYVGFLRAFGTLLNEQRRFWPYYAVVLACCCAAGAVYPLQAWIFANLINSFTSTDVNELSKQGNFWALMFFVLAISMFAVYFLLTSTAHTVSSKIAFQYRKQYLEDVLKKRIAFFDADGNSAGAIAGRLTTDVGQIEQVMGGQMSMSYVSIFNLIGSLIISFFFGWKLALVGSCVLLPLIVGAGIARIRLEIKYERMNQEVFADSSQFASEAVGAYRTVTSLGLQPKIVDRYDKLMRNHIRAAMIKTSYWTIIFALSQSISMACQAFILWYGGTLLADRSYTLTQYFVVYQAILQGGDAAGQWFAFAPNVANATAGANRLLSVRYENPTMEYEGKEKEPPEKTSALEVNNVHYAYKSRSIPVLTGLDLSIQPGQFIALVGATGCGKSTVISLLERFYDADKGSITYGGSDIKDLNVPAYRSKLSIVAQESTLYEGTVRENVVVSVAPESPEGSEESVIRACKDAQIHDFIASLPEGYNTRLGPRGVSLSGGQRQRLALARALLRNPDVLLLDEATSSLDSESEKLVQEAIDRAAIDGKRTTIAVAHRLATIQKADIIFVLGSGKVLERGTHQELLRAKGVYYSMCQAQALDR